MEMDLTTALKPDIYRVVAIVMVPGFVAAAPWTAGVFWPALQSSGTWEHGSLPISITAFGIVLVCGFILEDWGSRIEKQIDDKLLAADAQFFTDWQAYLALPTSPELIANRYMRAVLVRFKFELSMIPASILAAIGLIVSQVLGDGLGNWKTAVLALVFLMLARWLRVHEVKSSAKLLADVRRILIAAKN